MRALPPLNKWCATFIWRVEDEKGIECNNALNFSPFSFGHCELLFQWLEGSRNFDLLLSYSLLRKTLASIAKLSLNPQKYPYKINEKNTFCHIFSAHRTWSFYLKVFWMYFKMHWNCYFDDINLIHGWN